MYDIRLRNRAYWVILMDSDVCTEDGRCIVTLDTIGREDIATWYEVWAAVMAVDDMCMRFGRVGKAMEIGKCSRRWELIL